MQRFSRTWRWKIYFLAIKDIIRPQLGEYKSIFQYWRKRNGQHQQYEAIPYYVLIEPISKPLLFVYLSDEPQLLMYHTNFNNEFIFFEQRSSFDGRYNHSISTKNRKKKYNNQKI